MERKVIILWICNYSMETKTLYNLLKEKDYQVRGEQEREKLSLDCAEFIEQDNKAVWYSDLHRGIFKYIKELYLAEKIPKSPETRKRHKRISKWHIEDYLRINPNTNLSEDEIKEDVRNKSMENFCEGTAISELDVSRKVNSSLFNINNIYQTLRDYHKLSPQDKIELILPKDFVNQDNFEERRQKAIDLYEKRIDGKGNCLYFKRALKTIGLNKLPEYNHEFGKGISQKYLRNWKGHVGTGILKDFYLTLASHLPIAYKDPKKAIEFFETDTGINISNPKEHKKLVFGK